ncbi:MAG: hypothetical protein A3J93_03945 [Candidatus Magasanikbacteria bacterium RIFOXYC2_FULL_42_28]|uniref:DUF8128 domain-containing protein n=1 Tax=Candidatus Magasanikbacteria bacterium RIFOXYC2_FULL_42_28 TaxID=1798704 RepID=A0A1F6NVI4_9BACT|nr:MAG: hypothetical protein A3J93_03945 [Candidatus Magasanikbacteria bacterium RIFOXYC2_FULL_42_28]
MGGTILTTPFGFNVDITFWVQLFKQPTSEVIRSVYAIGGWTILALIFFWMGSILWVHYRQGKYTKNWQWVLLAVDVPPLYIQSPKAVEQIFAHLSGAKVGPNIGEKFWKGKKQKWFSLEIVGIDGYIQFLIRTENEFRDLVEAAIYAQYAEAEITEVDDYTGILPHHFPDDNYDIFGVEFALEENEAFPIRTYPSFEYNMSKDVVFSDPMAALLENFSRLGVGEQLWLHIVIEPTSHHWKEKGIDLVKDLVAGGGSHGGHHGGNWLVDFFSSIPMKIAQELMNVWNWNFEAAEGGHEEEATAGKVSELTPGNKTVIEAIENKIAKLGFKSKVRVLYISKKELYNPGKCIDGLVGAFSQFHVQNSNSLVAHHATLKHYAFKNYRLGLVKHHFVEMFRKRKIKIAGNPYILNIEELATIWHFPLPFVKTPLLQKAETKRGEPPMNLPLETTSGHLRMRRAPTPEPSVEIPSSLPMGDEPAIPPEDLPYG